MRTIVWVTILILILLFILFNAGNPADLNVWPKVGEEPPVIISGPMWAFALGFFLLGFLPMWLLQRALVWRLKRRISSLENSLRAAAAVASVEPPEPAPAIETAPGTAAGPQISEPQESNRSDVS